MTAIKTVSCQNMQHIIIIHINVTTLNENNVIFLVISEL